MESTSQPAHLRKRRACRSRPWRATRCTEAVRPTSSRIHQDPPIHHGSTTLLGGVDQSRIHLRSIIWSPHCVHPLSTNPPGVS